MFLFKYLIVIIPVVTDVIPKIYRMMCRLWRLLKWLCSKLAQVCRKIRGGLERTTVQVNQSVKVNEKSE